MTYKGFHIASDGLVRQLLTESLRFLWVKKKLNVEIGDTLVIQEAFLARNPDGQTNITAPPGTDFREICYRASDPGKEWSPCLRMPLSYARLHCIVARVGRKHPSTANPADFGFGNAKDMFRFLNLDAQGRHRGDAKAKRKEERSPHYKMITYVQVAEIKQVKPTLDSGSSYARL